MSGSVRRRYYCYYYYYNYYTGVAMAGFLGRA